MKFKSLFASLVILSILFTGCAQKDDTSKDTETTEKEEAGKNQNTGNTDAGTSASIVDNAEAFQKAISKEGTWIIAIIKDLNIDKELVLDGEYKNGKKDDKGNDVTQRKVALYAQDENRNITARYTLTAPKFTIKSPEASIQHGTFKGDVYVSVKNFQLIDATVDGNVYFTTDEAKSTFKMDEKSSVKGVQELKKS